MDGALHAASESNPILGLGIGKKWERRQIIRFFSQS
jgi:hypothetical protein